MIRKLACEIIESMENDPSNWHLTASGNSIYYGSNNKIYMAIYVAGGRFFLNIYFPCDCNFSFWEKCKIWKAINKWKCHYLTRGFKYE